MKKYIHYLLSAMLLTGAAACSDESENCIVGEDIVPMTPCKFGTSFDLPKEDGLIGESSLQKISYSGSGTTLYFNPSDKFAVIGTSGMASDPFSNSNDGNSATVSLTGMVDAADKDDAFYAVYPYASTNYKDGKISATIPSSQNAPANNFASDAFIAAGKSEPGDFYFHFKIGCSLLRINIPEGQEYSYAKIESANEAIAGKVNIDFAGSDIVVTSAADNNTITLRGKDGKLKGGNAYYVCVAPGTVTGDLKVTLYKSENTYFVRNLNASNKSIAFDRAVTKTANFSSYSNGNKIWDDLLLEGKNAIDLGMVVNGKKVYWAVSNCNGLFGQFSTSDNFGYGREIETPVDPVNSVMKGKWFTPSKAECEDLLAKATIKLNGDCYSVVYNNQTIEFPVVDAKYRLEGEWDINEFTGEMEYTKDEGSITNTYKTAYLWTSTEGYALGIGQYAQTCSVSLIDDPSASGSLQYFINSKKPYNKMDIVASECGLPVRGVWRD